MASPERSGLLGGYRRFNEVTRNIGIGVFGVALLVGSAGVATVAAVSVMVDQAQIWAIDKYKKWRGSKKQMQLPMAA